MGLDGMIADWETPVVQRRVTESEASLQQLREQLGRRHGLTRSVTECGRPRGISTELPAALTRESLRTPLESTPVASPLPRPRHPGSVESREVFASLQPIYSAHQLKDP